MGTNTVCQKLPSFPLKLKNMKNVFKKSKKAEKWQKIKIYCHVYVSDLYLTTSHGVETPRPK